MKEHNPPEDWTPRPVPTHDTEEDVLREAFGEPDEDGVYAPHVPFGGDDA